MGKKIKSAPLDTLNASMGVRLRNPLRFPKRKAYFEVQTKATSKQVKLNIYAEMYLKELERTY